MTGAELRRARQAAGYTLMELGEKMGVSPMFLCDVEHDRRYLAPAREDEARKILGLPPVPLCPHCGARQPE